MKEGPSGEEDMQDNSFQRMVTRHKSLFNIRSTPDAIYQEVMSPYRWDLVTFQSYITVS